jgi:hypothetical protein
VAAAAVLLLIATQLSAPGSRNASADAVVARSRVLGIDFRQGKGRETAGAPNAEASQALSRAGVAAWVDAQIQDESAEIGEAPAALREYLEQNRDALWSVVSALERDEPDWGPAMGKDGLLLIPSLPVLRLERVLVAFALVEEREGRSIESGRVLDAAWTLGRSVSSPPNIMTLVIGIGAERMQTGALRKFEAPAPQWLGRLSSDGPWPRMPDAMLAEEKFRAADSNDALSKASEEVFPKALRAVADALQKRSPCDPALASSEEIWKPANAALAAESNELRRSLRDYYDLNMSELIASFVQRAARYEVEREMTQKILQLRLEKDASPDGRWPEKLKDPTSAVCPAASYAYEWSSEVVTLRFVGSVEAPEGGALLPLRFRASNPPAPPVSRESE